MRCTCGMHLRDARAGYTPFCHQIWSMRGIHPFHAGVERVMRQWSILTTPTHCLYPCFLAFDCIDGPSPDSPRLYDVLKQHNTKATLFIVGSRAISYPTVLKRAYDEGHQIAIHTWSHAKVTGLSNEQIVAELKWTEKAIFDVIGVSPIYWRPPYGDVDSRVRNIATQLGFKTAIWTQGFDTNDVTFFLFIMNYCVSWYFFL